MRLPVNRCDSDLKMPGESADLAGLWSVRRPPLGLAPGQGCGRGGSRDGPAVPVASAPDAFMRAGERADHALEIFGDAPGDPGLDARGQDARGEGGGALLVGPCDGSGERAEARALVVPVALGVG